MRRTLLTLTILATLLAGLAAPASARQPEDLVPFLDIALAAKVQGSERALEVAGNPPGQSDTKIAERVARHQERVQRLSEKFGDDAPGSERSLEVHAILTGPEGACTNPGLGNGNKVGFSKKDGHRFAACASAEAFVPPGQLKEKPAGEAEVEDDDD